MKISNVKIFFIFVSIFSQLLLDLTSSAREEKNYISNSNIIWEKIQRKIIKNNKIIWEEYKGPLEFNLKREYPGNSFVGNQKNIYEELN